MPSHLLDAPLRNVVCRPQYSWLCIGIGIVDSGRVAATNSESAMEAPCSRRTQATRFRPLPRCALVTLPRDERERVAFDRFRSADACTVACSRSARITTPASSGVRRVTSDLCGAAGGWWADPVSLRAMWAVHLVDDVTHPGTTIMSPCCRHALRCPRLKPFSTHRVCPGLSETFLVCLHLVRISQTPTECGRSPAPAVLVSAASVFSPIPRHIPART